MRHLRSRKRFRAILILLLSLTFVLFFESKVESFAPQLRTIVEYKVGEAFGKNLELSIGDMDGGIFRPFMLNDVKIKGKGNSSILSSLEIKSIRSNFRIWDILIKGKEYRSVLSLLNEEPCIYVDFVTKNKEISGYIKLEGDARSADVQGYIILFEKKRIDINGKLRAGSFFVELRPRSGSLRIEGKMSPDGYFLTNVKASHIKFSGLDIVCEAVLKNRIVKTDADMGHLEGSIETKSLVLNYSLFPDVKASYRFYNGLLDLSGFEIGRDMKASGWISLRDPYNTHFICTTDNANLGAVLSYFGIHAGDMVSGTLNSKIEFKGPLRKVKTSAHILVRQGSIGKMDFDSMEAALKGDGPMMTIEESRFSRKSGFVSLAGEIDIRKIGKASIFQQIKLVTDDNAITWDKWEESNVKGVQKTEMKKKITDDINVGFKKFTPGQQVDESMRDKDEVELEYRLQPNESLKLMVGEDKNFFGWEHKDKF
jgi:hypothetical protein